ncbi:FAD-dependent monooxygenase [Pseudonocardia sp. NPDC046786]|uniref:FAD-dependent monooxygenase n=1 Tax=Pseudonocardia sp. NPDC046786 TaxID=3155471 RepID=UPI0033FDFB93
MRPASVAVLGGGPGGLYAARLFKLAHPAATVVVHEQSTPESTFGFGVAVASRTQRNLAAADPRTLDDVVAAGYPHDMRMLVGDAEARVHNGALIGIARPELLAILTRHALDAGVEIRYGRRTELAELDAELVVVADGVSSRTRTDLADELGARVDVAEGLYLWAGTEFALETAVFAPARTAHGTFVTHAYPYSPHRSTFLVETDEATWRAAGFDASTDAIPADASDTVALEYLSDAFAELLGGHRLIGNRTRWQRFRTVHCRRWTSGNAVLLGDAAHTAHYSVGSGTKLAMEDAIALCDAVTAAGDLPSAFADYEQQRRPQVERLQELARRSRLWWDSFPRRTNLPVDQLMVAYMTRTGNVALDRFAGTNPDVVRRALAGWAGTDPADVPTEGVVDWVFGRPLHHDRYDRSSRLLGPADRDELSAEPGSGGAGRLARVRVALTEPWSSEGDALVKRLHDLTQRGWDGFWLTGPDERAEVLTRLDIGERLRAETDGLVVVEAGPGHRTDLAAGLASGRTDLVCTTDGIHGTNPTGRT